MTGTSQPTETIFQQQHYEEKKLRLVALKSSNKWGGMKYFDMIKYKRVQWCYG